MHLYHAKTLYRGFSTVFTQQYALHIVNTRFSSLVLILGANEAGSDYQLLIMIEYRIFLLF